MLIDRRRSLATGRWQEPDGGAREALASQILARSLLIVLLMAGLLAGFMWVAARKSDELSIARQQNVIAIVLADHFRKIAHDQETSTFWDESVEKLKALPLDQAWLDDNLGVWMYTYYGHDEAFIVDGGDRLLYAMRGGKRADPVAYARSIGQIVRPLIAELRAKTRRGVDFVNANAVQTPGAIDLGTIHGHPAIISVKPIVSDTGEVPQPPGREYLHVSIRYLDGGFIADLSQRYQLADGRFSRSAPADPDEGRVALRTRGGALLGYFVWEPFRPGSVMLIQIAPGLIAALLVVCVIVGWLLRRISDSTMQLSAARSQAQHLADHDPLTGLANRARFDRELASDLAQLSASGELALLYIDLDHFKNVNDHLGHPTGDLLIRALSRILGELAPEDLVARLGGDEFAVVHPATDAVRSGERLCGQIHRALARPIDLGDGEVLIGASIGIAVAPRDGTDPVELVRKADIALYDAKLKGRRRHSFFTADMGDRIRQRNEIEADLRAAMVDMRDLQIVYQPFFATRDGAPVGAEALIRWTHPKYGLLPSELFIPVAEECGLIEPLNEWAIRQACAAAAQWRDGVVAVNVSAVQLRSPELAERIFATLKQTHLAPNRLELEITETSFLETGHRARTNLGWLRDIGVKIALDDFGTGYSSLKHLVGFEVDRIKIDQSFVTTIELGQPPSPVVRAIVDLARASGLATTAEGVETEQQRQYLTSIGCDVLQGFLLCEPLDEAAIAAFFADGCLSPRQ